MFASSIGQPANRVMLQELIKRYNLTDEQLDSEIEDSNTPKLALCFDNVELYSSSMGLAIAKQADVKQSCRTDGTQAAMMECLQIWKEHNPFQATYRALLNIVLGLEKGDTAHQICQQLTQCKYMYYTCHQECMKRSMQLPRTFHSTPRTEFVTNTCTCSCVNC